MAEDIDFTKLPLLQRCSHKLWKARVHGYAEATKQFQDEKDEKAAIFGQYAGLMSKFVGDTNAAAQEKGLEATLYFVQNSAIGGKTVKDVMGLIVAKSISAPKKSTQELSVQLALMYIEVEKQEAVVEELVKGLEHKNPKVVAACLSALNTALKEFGAQVINTKTLIKPLLGLLEDRDKTVRDESKMLLVEIYRWVGDALKPTLSKLKPIQLTELETEFAKVRGERAVPTRFLRSQQKKEAKAAAEAAVSGGDETSEVVGEIEVDPLSLIEPINVLTKIPSNFFENVDAKKWQDRKLALESLEKELDYPKFEKGDYADLVRTLTKVVTKDSNVVVVGIATKCIARLAAGLRKGFAPYAVSTLSNLLPKFKEKKANVVTPLREAVDAIFLSTTLEAIQEDVIASLDNKNPSIKAETAAFLGRCFALTTPVLLNKKLLKTFSTALLKTLSESDPTVRDSSAEALGVAMKVVSEKALMPFLPELDAIKLAKIKEFSEKAVVKAVPTKAAPPKSDPPPAKADNEPKKVLSGGAVRAQAPKVPKHPPAEKETEMSPEEVDEKALEYLQENTLKNLADASGKTRLDGIEQFQNVLLSMEPSKVTGEVMTKVLAKKPGFRDNNFEVMKLKLDCLKYMAESFPIAVSLIKSIAADITEKLSDPKNGTLAGETLMALAEASNLDVVGTQVLECAFAQKSVKVQQEALDWTGEAIQNFGLIIQTKTVIEHLKKGLNSTNAGVRQSSAALAGIVSMYMGQQLIQRLDEKPAAVALVTAEMDKRAGEEPLAPSRSCKVARTPETFAPAATQVSEPADEKPKEEKEKPMGRVDISPKITEQLLAELADKNWKVRNEALVALQGIVNDAKAIKSNLGELPGVLSQRFVDSNGKLAVTALELCSSLAVAMGPASKNQVRNFSRGIFNALGDNKQWVRVAGMACLNTWVNEAGAKEFFLGETIPEALKTGSASLKVEVWTWLSEVLPASKGLPKEELCLLIPYLFAAIEDRNADVRKFANVAVLGLMTHVGYYNMSSQAEKLKPASKNGIMQILEKVRPDIPEASPPPASKGKPESKPKAGTVAVKSVPKSRNSLVSSAKTSRKKEEEVDTSPLMTVNKLKNQRVLDEQKLKNLKWNFATPRPEFVELLRDQMAAAGFNKNLMNNMFHADFKLHIKAIESLSDDLVNEEALISNLDLILKWLTLRFFDTNPSVLLKGLEYLQAAFSLLIEREYTMFDTEVNSFIPYLVLKIGDPKDAVRDRVHAIFKQFALMHSPGKLFLLIMDGLKSKNSRQRTECLDELGYLIEQFGTSVCLPSLPVALKEISKQIADRDNSVRSAALNAIVKAYFEEGDRIYKLIGHLSDKDMSYLEERIKRASQNRTKMQKEESIRMPPQQEIYRIQKTEPEPVEEEIPEPEIEPQPVPIPSPKTYESDIPRKHFPTPRKASDDWDTRLAKLDLVDIDYSILDSPIHIPESIRLKMNKQAPPNPLMESLIRDLSSADLEMALSGGKKIHEVLLGETADKVEPYGKNILDSLITQFRYINTLTMATHGPTLAQVYKIVFHLINDIFGKKTAIAQGADENQLKIIIQQLMIAFVYEKTAECQEGGYNQWIAVFIARIVENADTTNVTCAIINALYDIVGNPPSNPKLTDVTTKCLLKVIAIHVRKANDIDEILNLDRVLCACHIFTQAYPRYTWKDRPSDLPLKAIKTLLMHLVTKKGSEILTHMRCIENPICSELAGYLKKLIKTQQGVPKSSIVLTKAMSEHLSEVFMKIAHDSTAREGMVQFYEFKKQHPDVDLSAIMASTTQFFQDYVAEGLRLIEKERGPLEKPLEVPSTPKTPSMVESHPYSEPPSDSNLKPQYYLNVLRWYQERLGMPVSTVPDFEPFEAANKK